MLDEEQQPLQETKRHGSVRFPFDLYPCSIPKDFPAVALHWHRNMELIYLKKGRGEIQVGMHTFRGEAGDIFILCPRALHAMREVPGETMEYETILFDPSFLGSGAADICAQRYLVPLAAGQLSLPRRLTPAQPEYAGAADCLRELEQLCKERKVGYELAVRGVLLRLLFLLLQMKHHYVPEEAPQAERLRTVLQRIETSYQRPLTVEQMAKECGLSSSHFMRWFRQLTGSSFVTYLNECRLSAAAERLRESSDTILAVSQAVGFENLSNFNRQFKKRYGMTPREYRRSEPGHLYSAKFYRVPRPVEPEE
jgi:AraC-like DNA-binding protein